MRDINLNELKSLLKAGLKEGDIEDFGRIEINCNSVYGYDDELEEITLSERVITIKQNW